MKVEKHVQVLGFLYVLPLMGITQHPENKSIMMVMKWCNSGDLRGNLHNYTTYYELYDRIGMIALGLQKIHTVGLFHQDLHTGNILLDSNKKTIFIGDLG